MKNETEKSKQRYNYIMNSYDKPIILLTFIVLVIICFFIILNTVASIFVAIIRALMLGALFTLLVAPVVFLIIKIILKFKK